MSISDGQKFHELFSLENKVVLLTGAASGIRQGHGRALLLLALRWRYVT